MALSKEADYRQAQEKLASMIQRYEQLRSMEAVRKVGSGTREELKDMMQPLNDLRGEIDQYEIKNGLRPEGAFITVKEIK